MERKNILIIVLISLFCSCIQLNNVGYIIEKPVPLENTTNRNWEQGWIIVPENRSNSNSNLIEIPFILSRAYDTLKVDHTPILIMSGGPGNSSLGMANGVVNTPWGKQNDILFIEQRGTSYANPSLVCPEIDSLRILGLKRGVSGSALDTLKNFGVKLCYERLTSQNIDLNGYNTIESIQDIEDLREALKIDSLILYGMSYSCNLMMAYAQTYPNNVKALILDSPLPHHANYDEEAYQNIDSTLIKIVRHYSGSLKLYYDWITYIHSVEDSVFTVSIDSMTYDYTRNELIDILLFKMSGHNTLPEVTKSIQNIIRGEHQEVIDIIQYYLKPTGQALGMRYSVWIGEELPEEKSAIIKQNQQQYEWLKYYPVNDVSLQTAQYWPVNSIYKTNSWPTSIYEGPALILSGQFDTWTPEWYGKMMLQYAPNANHSIYRNSSHLPGFTKEGFKDIHEFIKGL